MYEHPFPYLLGVLFVCITCGGGERPLLAGSGRS